MAAFRLALPGKRLGAFGLSFFGQARDKAAWLAEIERNKILVENMRRLLKFDEPCERRFGLRFRQKKLDPVCRFQRPAALRNEHSRHDPFAQISRRIEESHILAEFLIGPSAHDERQMNESLI